MMRIFLAFMVISTVIATSCTRSLTSEELDAYLADTENGLIQRQEVDDFAIEVEYRPAFLIIPSISKVGPYKAGSQYYILSLSQKGKEVLDPTQGFATYSSLVQLLAFRSQEFMMLTTSSGDTLLPSNSALERTYGMSGSTRILVAFPSNGVVQDVAFHLGEFGLHTGNIQFSFKKQDMLNVPILKGEARTSNTGQ